MRATFSCVLFCALSALWCGKSDATPILVANYSFETPVVCDGCNSGGVPGWDIATVVNPSAQNYPGAAGNGTPPGADGAQVGVLSGGLGFIKQFLRGNDGVLNTSDDPLVTAHTLYSLTVAIGWPADVPFSGYTIELDAWDPDTNTYTALGIQTNTITPSAGQFVDATLLIDTTSINPSLIGQRLVIWLFNTNSSFSYTHFDNVRLNGSSRITAVSRKTHAGVPREINLPLTGTPGIECRSGGANNDYQVVLTFDHTVTFGAAAVSSGIASVSNASGNGTAIVTVSLTGVANVQTITLNLSNVNDGTNTYTLALPMSILIGDTTGDRTVNSSDIIQTKTKLGQPVDATNFRNDVNVDGTLNSSDLGLVKSKLGTGL